MMRVPSMVPSFPPQTGPPSPALYGNRPPTEHGTDSYVRSCAAASLRWPIDHGTGVPLIHHNDMLA